MARTKRAVDVTGQTFGRLTVIERAHWCGKVLLWRCKCQCGRETFVPAGKLRIGHTRSCGCLRKDAAAANGLKFVKDRTGQRFGRWTVLHYVSTKPVSDENHTEAQWWCRCDCGVEKVVRGGNLQSGGSLSCGCLSRERAVVVAKLNFAERIALNTLPVGRASALSIYRAYIKGAKIRNLSFELSLDSFLKLTSSECAYCGAKPCRVSIRKRTNGPWIYNGIDRVDNTLGYIPGNMVPCCYRCNSAKQNHTLANFFDWIHRIYSRKEAMLATVAS